MSPEERQLLTDLFTRTRAAAATPRDRDAEALVEQAVREQPAAAYYLAQAVIVQEKALAAAADRLHALEARIAELEHEAAQSGPWSRNAATPSRQSAYAMQPQAPAPQSFGGPWGGQQAQAASAPGGGFLRGALGTAAGVAGGMLLANSISGLFSNHSGLAGIGSPFGNASAPGTEVIEETVINNNYGSDTNRQETASTDNDDSYQQADYDDQDTSFDDGDSFA